jgi:nucleoid-associated protein YgaU
MAESSRKLAKGLPADTKVEAADKLARVERGEEITGGAGIRVRAGDTLWRLARKYLGRGEDWKLLAAANPQVSDPTRMRPGTWVRLPDRAAASPPGNFTKIRVAQGDTLWKLSRAYLGSGAAWQCMAQANPQIRNSDEIVAGQTLQIPKDCAAHPAT